MLLWRDEASPWLQALEARDDKTRDRAGIDAWSARGNLAVSMVGSLHPDGAGRDACRRRPTASSRAFSSPGLARPRGVRLPRTRPPREDEAVNMLHRIAGVVGSPDRPLALSFDEPARHSLTACLARMAEAGGNAEGLEAAWLGKGKGTVVRLAAVLALLEWSRNVNPPRPPGTVGRDHVVSASRLWQSYFLPHARAVFDRGAPSDIERQVRRVALLVEGGCRQANTGLAHGDQGPGAGQHRECPPRRTRAWAAVGHRLRAPRRP